jgi:hypothetical protein
LLHDSKQFLCWIKLEDTGTRSHFSDVLSCRGSANKRPKEHTNVDIASHYSHLNQLIKDPPSCAGSKWQGGSEFPLARDHEVEAKVNTANAKGKLDAFVSAFESERRRVDSVVESERRRIDAALEVERKRADDLGTKMVSQTQKASFNEGKIEGLQLVCKEIKSLQRHPVNRKTPIS